MTILNEPWREFERRQRRDQILSLAVKALVALGWIVLGMVIGNVIHL